MYEPILVADIGGTNARFAIAKSFDKKSNQVTLEQVKKLPSSDFNDFESALDAYLSTLSTIPKRACFAVAGPRKGDKVFITNLGWEFEIPALQNRFGFTQFKIINDFAAFAEAAPFIDVANNLTVKQGIADETGNIGILGPGTGFGASALVRGQNINCVLSCEAGHASLAATTEQELDIIRELSKKFEYVSVERVFSGPGIENLYLAIAAVTKQQVKPLSASEISQNAIAESCPVCVETLNQLCDWLGSLASDLALNFNATGGIFIGGGILPRFTDILLASQFTQRFIEKGKMKHIVKDIPVVLITQDNVPLVGAAASLETSPV